MIRVHGSIVQRTLRSVCHGPWKGYRKTTLIQRSPEEGWSIIEGRVHARSYEKLDTRLPN